MSISDTINRFFRLDEAKTDIKTETIAGITTFLTMAYILFVNPQILADAGMDKHAIVAATIFASAFGTLLTGLLANTPVAMAPGMGLNAFFTYTLVIGQNVSWQTALGAVFLSGLLFFALTLFGVREKIINTIPKSLILAISAGIGIFLTFIGLQNLGLVVKNPATAVSIGAFTPEIVLGLLGLLLMSVLIIKNVRGALLIGIISTTASGFIYSYASGYLGLPALATTLSLPSQIFSLNIDTSLAFTLDISGCLKAAMFGPIFTLMFMDLFDSLGTLAACSREAGLVKEDGTIRNIRKLLGIDAAATMFGAVAGTSTTVSYIESAAGIAEGGRTGLTSVVTGLMFLLGLLLIPLIAVVPTFATAPALMIVGLFMMKHVTGVDFRDFEASLPVFMTIVLIPLTYSISTGLAFGFISWTLIKAALLKSKEVSPVMWVITALSVASLIL